jgi:hypothetical protein
MKKQKKHKRKEEAKEKRKEAKQMSAERAKDVKKEKAKKRKICKGKRKEGDGKREETVWWAKTQDVTDTTKAKWWQVKSCTVQ